MSRGAEVPSVAMSFANNFWGKDNAGVAPLLDRMAGAKQTCDELKLFYNSRAAIEDEYARKLMALCRKSLGTNEMGTLKTALDTVRGEVDAMAKQHQSNAAQMKTELEEPLAAFAGAMKERRKIVQNGVEKILKVMNQQTATVIKTKERYQSEGLKIKGYMAQGHMVMGQEERRINSKLEKSQIALVAARTEYEHAVKALEDTTTRWNREWKAATDKFQDLEEERLDFSKSSLWTFANIASTVCVSDDASCEKVRLSLEKMEVEKDIANFIKEKGTGQEIPDPPKFVPIRGDDDAQSMTTDDDDDNYSVAQFPRNINPAFRSSSPQPSTYDSHHDPTSSLARDLGHGEDEPPLARDQVLPLQQQQQKSHQQPKQQQQQQQQQQQPRREKRDTRRDPAEDSRPRHMPNGSQYDPDDYAPVPHDPYPQDGMTMLCRPPNPTASDLSGVTSGSESQRPNSRDEYSDLTSYSSQEPLNTKPSPVKREPVETDPSQMRRQKSGIFKGRSPFSRKKSVKDLQSPGAGAGSGRSSWQPGSNTGSSSSRHQMYGNNNNASGTFSDRRGSNHDAIDANASVAINIGDNVLPVSLPGRGKPAAEPEAAVHDPVAKALAELGGSTGGKQSSVRVSADAYHRLATPAPGSQATFSAAAAGMRGTPPPSYDQQVQRLGVPAAACTSKAMKETSQKYTHQTRSLFSEGNGGGSNYSSPSRTGNRSSTVPRAASPAPPRSTSPRPGMHPDTRQSFRAPSPNPYGGSQRGGSAAHHEQRNGSVQSRSTPTRGGPDPGYDQRHQSPNDVRAHVTASPSPYDRPASRNEFAAQHGSSYGGGGGGGGGGGNDGSMRGRGGSERPGTSQGNRGMSLYEPAMTAPDMGMKQRSRSLADVGRKYTGDGKEIMHFARAMYVYSAAIPEELGFAKGDTLAVIRHQDDGWWEAEVTVGANAGQGGLVPSNYLQVL